MGPGIFLIGKSYRRKMILIINNHDRHWMGNDVHESTTSVVDYSQLSVDLCCCTIITLFTKLIASLAKSFMSIISSVPRFRGSVISDRRIRMLPAVG